MLDSGSTQCPCGYVGIMLIPGLLPYNLAAAEGMKLHQLDIETAFLLGDWKRFIWSSQQGMLKEVQIYVLQGLSADYTVAIVCHLKKALYGLNQAPTV